MLMNPQQLAERIIAADPSLAAPLFILLNWAAKDGTRDSDEFEEVLDVAFMQTEEYRAARSRYAERVAA